MIVEISQIERIIILIYLFKRGDCVRVAIYIIILELKLFLHS